MDGWMDAKDGQHKQWSWHPNGPRAKLSKWTDPRSNAKKKRSITRQVITTRTNETNDQSNERVSTLTAERTSDVTAVIVRSVVKNNPTNNARRKKNKTKTKTKQKTRRRRVIHHKKNSSSHSRRIHALSIQSTEHSSIRPSIQPTNHQG